MGKAIFGASLPSRERGLKLGSLSLFGLAVPSLPSRERGLKHSVTARVVWLAWVSLPSRERGLKLAINKLMDRSRIVAPFAGAWIETGSSGSVSIVPACRSLRGSVD